MTKETKKLVAALSLPLIMLFAVIWKFAKAYINLDVLELIILILFFGFVFYYVIFRAPASDQIFSALTDKEIDDMRAYLAANGIQTYVKNRSMNRQFTKSGPVNPSLHIVNIEDCDRAIQLIRSRTT